MRVWVDVDNAPHALVFGPVIRRLEERGAEVRVTARDRTYTLELLNDLGVPFTVVGRGQPKGAAMKAAALMARSLGLAAFGARGRFDVAVGHGSRALPPAARALGVPNLTMFDYEHVSTWIFRRFCDRILVPRVVAESANGSMPRGAWKAYEGMKEEIYLSNFRPDPGIRQRLGVGDGKALVVIRPPSRSAHYHDARSEAILRALVARLRAAPAWTIWLRRDPTDPVPEDVAGAGFHVPDAPLDGPALIAAADRVISGGGTMTREAALLGTPAYSVFTGPMGAVDAELIRSGLLVPIRSAEDATRIPLDPKPAGCARIPQSGLLDSVVDEITDLARHRR
jgi:uncharacterized protein